MKESKEKILAEIQSLYRETDAIDETMEELGEYYNNSDSDAPDGWWSPLIDQLRVIEIKIAELKSKL